jgi:hypothetical protein
MVPYVLQLYLAKNPKFEKTDANTEAREKISTIFQSLEF